MSRAFLAWCAVLLLCQARPAEAQRVVLRIRPPIGDTLRMQMEQRFEMTGDNGTAVSGLVAIWTHAVPLRRHGGATEIVSVTDSVVVTPPAAASLPPLQGVKRALEGRTVHLRIKPDGELTLRTGGAGAAPSGFADMAAVLPAGPVGAGATWTRALRVPLATSGESTALVHTRLRLDSLGAGGAVAYLSLHGEFTHDHARDHPGHPPHARGKVTGTIAGTMQLDRRLGWITDSRTTITLDSVLEPPGKRPVHIWMRVSQWLRAIAGD